MTLSLVDLSRDIYARVLSTFTNLIDLDISSINFWQRQARLAINSLPPMTCFSLNIIKLSINVDIGFWYGRLAYLHTSIVTIYDIQASTLDISSRVWIFLKISFSFIWLFLFKTLQTNLKYFSLTSHGGIKFYDSHVVRLLHRMICLEQMTLYLIVNQRSTFIDDNHVENGIHIHMPRLQEFIFNIITYTSLMDEINRQSNTDIRRIFFTKRYSQVGCYVDYYPRGETCSHVYSLPYTMNKKLKITLNFPEGLFPNIRQATSIRTRIFRSNGSFLSVTHSPDHRQRRTTKIQTVQSNESK